MFWKYNTWWYLFPCKFFIHLKAFSAESQQLVNGGGSSTTLAPEMSSLEESTFKVGKLSVEQRKEKIHRYMKKRNERNFSKKIKVNFFHLCTRWIKLNLSLTLKNWYGSMPVEKHWRIVDLELEEGLQRMMSSERPQGLLVAITMKTMRKM